MLEEQSATSPDDTLNSSSTNDTPVSSETDILNQGFQQLTTEIQQLQQDFDTKIKYDESKERMVDALHSELQSYREGLHLKILRPLLTELIDLYDDANQIIEETRKNSPAVDEAVFENMQSFADGVEDLLRNNEVESFQVEGEVFDASQQRALHAIKTDDAALNKRIARRVRKGFRYNNRILRPEIVEAYRYIAAQ